MEDSSKVFRSGDLLFRRVPSNGELLQTNHQARSLSPTLNSAPFDPFLNGSPIPSGHNAFSSSHPGISSATSPRQMHSSSTNGNNNNNNTCCTIMYSRWSHMPWKSKLILLVTILCLIGFTLLLNSSGSMALIRGFLRWVQSIGWWGNFMFLLMFLLVSFPVILGGYIPLTLGAGAIYGVALGTVTVSISSTFGACVAFWVCRHTFRDWAERTLRDTREFRFFTYMIQSREHRLVSYLARLSPIPFGLQNSFFALTDISFRDYTISTWIGLLPFQVVWTQMGTTLRNLSKIGTADVELDFWQKISIFVQVVVSVALMVYFYYISKKLKREEETVELVDDVELGDKPSDIQSQEMYKEEEDISHLHLLTPNLITNDPDRVVIEIPNNPITVGGR